MTPADMEKRIVRYGDLKPCKTAFIDAHTPGSDQKENFTIIGAGVSESPGPACPHQGDAGLQYRRRRPAAEMSKLASLPPHRRTFFVLKGRWRFFWGRHGDAGEVTLDEGDIFDIPTGIFRGFENIGTDYGMIMAILGGDDAGGGVIWAPEVIKDAQDHGLVLGENGSLYDTKKGEALPEGVAPMPLLSEPELAEFPETPVADVVPAYVGRYHDMMALASKAPAKVIGEDALIKDRPGFEVDFLTPRLDRTWPLCD